MEKLKELLIIALIWAVIIWFARIMKRKSDEQSKKIPGKYSGNGID